MDCFGLAIRHHFQCTLFDLSSHLQGLCAQYDVFTKDDERAFIFHSWQLAHTHIDNAKRLKILVQNKIILVIIFLFLTKFLVL